MSQWHYPPSCLREYLVGQNVVTYPSNSASSDLPVAFVMHENGAPYALDAPKGSHLNNYTLNISEAGGDRTIPGLGWLEGHYISIEIRGPKARDLTNIARDIIEYCEDKQALNIGPLHTEFVGVFDRPNILEVDGDTNQGFFLHMALYIRVQKSHLLKS